MCSYPDKLRDDIFCPIASYFLIKYDNISSWSFKCVKSI